MKHHLEVEAGRFLCDIGGLGAQRAINDQRSTVEDVFLLERLLPSNYFFDLSLYLGSPIRRSACLNRASQSPKLTFISCIRSCLSDRPTNGIDGKSG
jgi:hypothetical protein